MLFSYFSLFQAESLFKQAAAASVFIPELILVYPLQISQKVFLIQI